MGSKTAGLDDGSLVGDGCGSNRPTAALVIAALAAGLGLLVALGFARIGVRAQTRVGAPVPVTAPWPVPVRLPQSPAPPVPELVGQGITRIDSPEGRLKVTYTVETSPTESQGSTLTGVTGIEFHPGYVTVVQGDRGGQVFFADRTKELSWAWDEPAK